MQTERIDSPARVFVSCGQDKASDEVRIVAAIATELKQIGFEPWIAVENQTLSGIQEFVFNALKNSEYFIFVDFNRHSLFSHQELAIASFLGLELLAFRESETRLEGLLAFLGANAKTFNDRTSLPGLVADTVRHLVETGQWSVDWRSELVLERDPAKPFDDADWKNGDRGRYFQITVKNRHRSNVARDCSAYLEKATRLDPRESIPLNTFELKWDGFMAPYANVLPLQSRRFDGGCVAHSRPGQLLFLSPFADADKAPHMTMGRYELTYVVLSSNFPAAHGTFILNLDSRLEGTSLAPVK
jgi:hypothetical protein